MNLTQTKTTHITSEKPRAYKVTITDTVTNEVVQEYNTEIAILFAIQKGDIKESLPVQMFQLGNGFQLAKLLAIVNNTVTDYLSSLFKNEKKMTEGGAKVD